MQPIDRSLERRLDVLILRDPHESPQKCSLIPLRGTPGLDFHTYDSRRRLDATGRILLHPEGSDFTSADRGLPLLVVDSSWRRLPKLLACVDGVVERRRLPALVTAYPRKSKTFADPAQGLASVEALYAALVLLGETHPELLAHYRWRDDFLRLNPVLSAPVQMHPEGHSMPQSAMVGPFRRQ